MAELLKSEESRSQDWKIIVSGDLSGAENMRIDQEHLAQGVNCIRFYGWEPACLTYGNAQNPEREFDLNALQNAGIDCVKRPTGGRAVLHIQELTYSVCGQICVGDWSVSLAQTYAEINRVLAIGFNALNLGVILDRGELPDVGFVKGGISKPCFASTSQSELVFEGRKVVGSAQRRTRDAFLQHGSIFFKDLAYDVVDYMNLSDAEKEFQRSDVKKHAISLEEFAPHISRECLQSELVRAFEHNWNAKY